MKTKYHTTLTEVCSDCGTGCRKPYVPGRAPRCRKCQNKARMKELSQERVGCPSVWVVTASRTEEEQAIIEERVCLYEWRYDRGLDLYTGKPLGPEDFVENGWNVVRTPSINKLDQLVDELLENGKAVCEGVIIKVI